MKKRIIFTAFNLDVGGVEKCLVNLVNSLDDTKFDITVMLQVKEGIYLKDLNKNIHLVSYNLSKIKNKLLRKIVNIFKYIILLIKNYHKYDTSICYAPGYIPSSIFALIASKKRVAWMHTNLKIYMDNYKPYEKKNISNEKKIKKFVNRMFFRKYDKKVFVSKNAMEAYLNVFPQDKPSCLCIYNLASYEEILSKSKEKITLKKEKNFTFINVSRHTEFDKRLSRIINAADKLNKEGYNFKILFVGDGNDNKEYRSMVKKYHLEDKITFLGKKSNPYPYFLLADAFVLSSAFEGFPTTFTESLVLGVPIITTDVSDAKTLINKNYGIVVENNDDDIYLGMKKALEGKIKTQKFYPQKFNNDILKKVEDVLK